MHTHFGSATNGTGQFLNVLIMGSVWRLAWLHVLNYGHKRNSRHAIGFAKAGLFQY